VQAGRIEDARLWDRSVLDPIWEQGRATLFQGDCRDWLAEAPPNSIHAVVTDPPYGLVEYSEANQAKLRAGRGGIWRIAPKLGGHQRSPLPRFTVLEPSDHAALYEFFYGWGKVLFPALKPGAHVFIATNQLVSPTLYRALLDAGFERRGEIVRLVRTLRGGDRPKGAELEFPEVSAMPRACWEPWGLFRKPFGGTLAANLRAYGTGALRRPALELPFCDVIDSRPATKAERKLAAHPSLKPQDFLRQLCRASLPLGYGRILDPFCGSGSTLAACEFLGAESIGIEADETYVRMAISAIPGLAALPSR
jgi:site-specific DNA-methyltransferase (adenine-specific)